MEGAREELAAELADVLEDWDLGDALDYLALIASHIATRTPTWLPVRHTATQGETAAVNAAQHLSDQASGLYAKALEEAEAAAPAAPVIPLRAAVRRG